MILLSFIRELHPDRTFGSSSDGYIWLERDIECDERVSLYEFVNLIYNEDLAFVMLNLSASILPTTEEILEDEASEDEASGYEDDDDPSLDHMVEQARAMMEKIIPSPYVNLEIDYGYED